MNLQLGRVVNNLDFSGGPDKKLFFLHLSELRLSLLVGGSCNYFICAILHP